MLPFIISQCPVRVSLRCAYDETLDQGFSTFFIDEHYSNFIFRQRAQT
jgi:hypothetical protein